MLTVNGPGLIPIRGEGCPIHPDWFEVGVLTDEQYLMLLENYAEYYSWDTLFKTQCRRDDLLLRLKERRGSDG